MKRSLHWEPNTAGPRPNCSFADERFPRLAREFRNKEPRLSRLWGTRLATQMVLLPEFDGVFRAVQRSLRQAGLLD